MKRIYFLLMTMAVFLMTGCSDNDVIGPEPPVVDGEETIFFSIGASGGLTTTKAEPVTLPGEDYIHDLTVLLFDSETGAFADGTKKTFDLELDKTIGTAKIEEWEIKPGLYDVLLIANSGTKNFAKGGANEPANLAAMKTALADDVTTQEQEYLVMASELFTGVDIKYLTAGGMSERRTYYYMVPEHFFEKGKTAFTEKQNFTSIYTGTGKMTPIKLTRLASRIQLESIAVDFTENLTGATFRLDSVFLVNARPSTLLIPDADGRYEVKPTTGTKYYRGAPEEFNIIYGMIAPDAMSGLREDYYKEDYAINITKTEPKTFGSTDMFRTYAFENHTPYVYSNTVKDAYDTRLVIAGEITLATGQGLGACYYHIPIKGNDILLERNNIYSINVKITSYGYNRPDGSVDEDGEPVDPKDPEDPNNPNTPNNNAKIEIEIDVNPWKVVNQYEEETL